MRHGAAFAILNKMQIIKEQASCQSSSDIPAGPLQLAKSVADHVNCTLDSVRCHVRPFLGQHRPFFGFNAARHNARTPSRAPRQVCLRGTPFAAAIPGDGVVEQVFTTGISSFLNLYNTVLIGRIILTWFPSAPPAIVQPLSTITDPYLNLFRGIIPPLGGTLDLSPILAFVALDLFTNAAAALPCELEGSEEDGKKQFPFQMMLPSKAALKFRGMARRKRQVQGQKQRLA